jgi:hypothetical protein
MMPLCVSFQNFKFSRFCLMLDWMYGEGFVQVNQDRLLSRDVPRTEFKCSMLSLPRTSDELNTAWNALLIR